MKIDFIHTGNSQRSFLFPESIQTGSFVKRRSPDWTRSALQSILIRWDFKEVYRYISGTLQQGRGLTGDGERIPHLSGDGDDIAEGGHTLIIGPMECILEMNRRLEPHKEKGSFLPFEKTGGACIRVSGDLRGRAPVPGRGTYSGIAAGDVGEIFLLDVNGKDLARDRDDTWRRCGRSPGS